MNEPPYITLKNLKLLLEIMKKHIGTQKTKEIFEEFKKEYEE